MGNDGTLFVPSYQQVSAVDQNGAMRWQSSKLPVPFSCYSRPLASGIVADGAGTIYLARGFDGYCTGPDGPPPQPPTSTLFALDATSGVVLDSIDLEAAAGCAATELAIGAGHLYAVCGERLLDISP